LASWMQYLSAIVSKRWSETADQVDSIPTTITPIVGLKQRSVVTFDTIPLILATGNGSFFNKERPPFPATHNVPAIGRIDMKVGFATYTQYRAYLSQGAGAYIHLVVEDQHPDKILECRLYQPYKEIGTGDVIDGKTDKMYKTVAEAEAAGWQGDHSWEFWLLDNSDPNVGGFLGCPVMVGKNEDGSQQYLRSLVASDQRIPPIAAQEVILDATGGVSYVQHQLMPYGRQLEDGKTFEYMMVSAVETPQSAGIVMSLGIDLALNDLTIAAV
jgi:hypothetical protein